MIEVLEKTNFSCQLAEFVNTVMLKYQNLPYQYLATTRLLYVCRATHEQLGTQLVCDFCIALGLGKT